MDSIKDVSVKAVPIKDVPTKKAESLTIICAWCTLLKNGVINGQLVWPEPWSPARVFIDRKSEIYQRASHGICVECSHSLAHKELKGY